MKLNQSNPNRATSPNKLLVAFLFILVGSLLFARNFGFITPDLFSILVSWQMLLVVLGLYALLTRHFFSGLIMLIIGVGCGLSMLELPWMPINPGSTIIWPLILIIIGLMIVFKPHHRKRLAHKFDHLHDPNCSSATKQHYHSEDGVLRSENTFGGVHHVILDEVFKSGVITNTFGGTVIDLRHTKINEGETYLDIDNNWGGVELYVPSDWQVAVRCNAFMGACEDKRWKSSPVDTTRTLVIRGKVSFGGIEIKD